MKFEEIVFNFSSSSIEELLENLEISKAQFTQIKENLFKPKINQDKSSSTQEILREKSNIFSKLCDSYLDYKNIDFKHLQEDLDILNIIDVKQAFYSADINIKFSNLFNNYYGMNWKFSLVIALKD